MPSNDKAGEGCFFFFSPLTGTDSKTYNLYNIIFFLTQYPKRYCKSPLCTFWGSTLRKTKIAFLIPKGNDKYPPPPLTWDSLRVSWFNSTGLFRLTTGKVLCVWIRHVTLHGPCTLVYYELVIVDWTEGWINYDVKEIESKLSYCSSNSNWNLSK